MDNLQTNVCVKRLIKCFVVAKEYRFAVDIEIICSLLLSYHYRQKTSTTHMCIYQ